MKVSRSLMHVIVRPLSVWRCLDGFIRPDIRVAEEVTRRDDDITEDGDVVDGSEAILRSLGEVRRFCWGKDKESEEQERGHDAY